jgi:hypothetical protein
VVEVDQMEGTTPLQLEQTINGVVISLAGLYAPANLEVEVLTDESNLPREETVRLADLHALMTAHRRRDVDDAAVHIHVLVVTEDQDDPDTLGIMFDFGDQDSNDVPREAFAIFESAHRGLPGGVERELLLTSAHELAHCFNLHHSDWEGSSFKRDSTIEGYSLTDSVRWALSSKSLAHLTTHDPRMVIPGGGSLPFGLETQAHIDLHASFPPEHFEVIDPSRSAAIKRAPGLGRDAAVRASLAWQRSRRLTADEEPLRLELWSHKDGYEVGEPIELTARLRNDGAAPVEALALLEPEYGFLNVALRRLEDDGERWVPFQPAVRRDARAGMRTASIAPGEALHGQARVFFGSAGWTFEEPGTYEIVADYPGRDLESDARLVSEPLRIVIAAPATEAGITARRILSEESSAHLGKEQGLYLLFQGGAHLEQGAAKMRELVQQAPAASHAASANLALAQAALEPSIDPTRRAAPAADLDAARRYYEAVDAKQISPWALQEVSSTFAGKLLQRGDTAESQERIRESSEQFREMELEPVDRRELDEKLREDARTYRLRDDVRDAGRPQ